jgi:Glycosyl transferases group 1
VIKILFASRLVHEKWVDILIDCIESFTQDRELQSQIEWHICSDGDARETIVELTKKYKNVTYHGRLSQDKLQELYRQVDILFMPSRFLETFGLTALEALTCGTPVCAPAKWGLRPFVTGELTLDESRPVESFREILGKRLRWETWELPDIHDFSEENWNKKLRELFESSSNILIVHDYEEKIGWAEYYIELVRESLQDLWKNVSFYGYRGQTTVWKRRIMFILSIFAFWRGIALYNILKEKQIDTIWMHSILRYIGPWGILAVRLYNGRRKTYISHHDIGLLAAFPQDITSESSIPMGSSLREFIPDTSMTKKIISVGKYIYVRIITSLLPTELTHIIFAPFLEANIRGQFGKNWNEGNITKKDISQKQEIQGREIFPKGVYWDINDWGQNLPNEEVRRFSDISIEVFPHKAIVRT